jgi:hypothetical protein
MKNFSFFICAFYLILSFAGLAQVPKPAPVKWKPPQAQTFLEAYHDTVSLSAEECKKAIALPLHITDAKKFNYVLVSYQCLYRRIGVTEDEQTGKTSPATSMVAQTFKTTPLSDLWLKIINEDLKSGEEIYFFDVVSKDAQGKFFFAPNLLIKIK